MRQIENDVPPAGFIDDGTDYIEHEESQRLDGEDMEDWMHRTHGTVGVSDW